MSGHKLEFQSDYNFMVSISVVRSSVVVRPVAFETEDRRLELQFRFLFDWATKVTVYYTVRVEKGRYLKECHMAKVKLGRNRNITLSFVTG